MNRLFIPIIFFVRDNIAFLSIFKNSKYFSPLFDYKKDCQIAACLDRHSYNEMSLDDDVSNKTKACMRDSKILDNWDYHLTILNLQPTSWYHYDDKIFSNNILEYEENCSDDDCCYKTMERK